MACVPLQVWITGTPGTTLRSALATEPVLATFSYGAPQVQLTDLRLVGSLRVQGGKLRVLRCSISSQTSRQPNTPPAVRALSIIGGEATLVQTVLRDHVAGAIEVNAGTLSLFECRLQGSHAESGGAMLVVGDSKVTVVTSNFTGNSADYRGGAIQVRRHGLHAPQVHLQHIHVPFTDL
jgi:hypothetical protein